MQEDVFKTYHYKISRLVYIYTIVCPETGAIKYVGKTNSPKSRFQQHIRCAIRKQKVSANLYKWMKEVLSKGSSPIFNAVDVCCEGKENELEAKWFANFDNGQLLNIRTVSKEHRHIDIMTLRGIMEARSIKQIDIAKNLGLRPQTVSLFLRGRFSELSQRTAFAIAHYINTKTS